MDDVISESLRIVKYRPDEEGEDHWDTPKEFIERGFQGDCEDIAVFMMATLKRLEYDGSVKILGVRTLMGDHTMLRVQMPDGQWKNYETIPVPLIEFDQLFYRPIVDELVKSQTSLTQSL